MGINKQLLTDIRLGLRHSEFRPVYTADCDYRYIQGKSERFEDIGLINDVQNLGQAIIIRLCTPRGELAALAHPEYGSRLSDLVGRPNTETTRNLAKLYILESLKLEPRIEKVINVSVEPAQGTRDRINIMLVVKPIGSADAVTIGPFNLELAK